MSKVTYIEDVLKPLEWLGSTRKTLRKWPHPVKKAAGLELQALQRGCRPVDWKPVPIVGLGAEEIRLTGADGQYRILYVAKFSEAIYVLHVITKKTTQKTTQKDITLAQEQYKTLMRRRREGSR